jgi:hypothetical protein
MEPILPLIKLSADCDEYIFEYIHEYQNFLDVIINPTCKEINDDNYNQKINHTANYMFNVIGYGVFVSIKNNKVFVFQPFANIFKTKSGTENLTEEEMDTFTNEKLKMLKLNENLRKYHTITQNKEQWGFSDCIFFYWDKWWKDIELYLNIYFDMLTTICKHAQDNKKKIQDTHFFLNLFDQPVAFKKTCDQYINQEIVCDKNELSESSPFIQIFSGSTSDLHYDSCMIYADAWEVASQKKFGNSCRDWYFNKESQVNNQWEQKNNMITFRGRNSSCYPNDEDKNDRLKVINIIKSVETTIQKDIGLSGVIQQTLYVDGKLITSDTEKVKKIVGEFISPKSMIEQSNSKFIVDIDGYVTPWRLVFELSYGSVILLFKSKYKSWFYDKLIHLENIYIIDVPNNENLSDDISKALNFFSENDAECQKIANGAKLLFKDLTNIDNLSMYMIENLNAATHPLSVVTLKSIDPYTQKLIEQIKLLQAQLASQRQPLTLQPDVMRNMGSGDPLEQYPPDILKSHKFSSGNPGGGTLKRRKQTRKQKRRNRNRNRNTKVRRRTSVRF